MKKISNIAVFVGLCAAVFLNIAAAGTIKVINQSHLGADFDGVIMEVYVDGGKTLEKKGQEEVAATLNTVDGAKLLVFGQIQNPRGGYLTGRGCEFTLGKNENITISSVIQGDYEDNSVSAKSDMPGKSITCTTDYPSLSKK